MWGAHFSQFDAPSAICSFIQKRCEPVALLAPLLTVVAKIVHICFVVYFNVNKISLDNMNWNFKRIGENFPTQQFGGGVGAINRDDDDDAEMDELSSDDGELEEEEEEGKVVPNPSDRPVYKMLSQRSSRIPKFSLTDFVSEFEIDPAIQFPEEALRSVVEEQIERAYEFAERESGRKVTYPIVSMTKKFLLG